MDNMNLCSIKPAFAHSLHFNLFHFGIQVRNNVNNIYFSLLKEHCQKNISFENIYRKRKVS